MLPSVLKRKCGSICACSASMRASSTVRSSCSVSARRVASFAVSSARRLPPATTLMMIEARISDQRQDRTLERCCPGSSPAATRGPASSTTRRRASRRSPTTSRRGHRASRGAAIGLPGSAGRGNASRSSCAQHTKADAPGLQPGGTGCTAAGMKCRNATTRACVPLSGAPCHWPRREDPPLAPTSSRTGSRWASPGLATGTAIAQPRR